MAKNERQRLTDEEFAALKEVADKPMQSSISEEQRGRLITAGFIREVVGRSGGVYALVPTQRGLRQLRSAGWSPDNVPLKKDVRSKNNG
jgi:hypothetical protein